MRAKTKTGKQLDVLLSIEPIKMRDHTDMLLQIYDITERIKITNELKNREERIRILLNSTAEAIYGIDMEGNCIFCNKSCLQMLKYDHEDELLGKNMHYQIHYKYEDGTPYDIKDCLIFDAFKKGKQTHIDSEVFWKSDGTCFPAEYWSYPMFQNGDLCGAVVTFLDITERKNANIELLLYKNHLEDMVRVRTAELNESENKLKQAKEAAESANKAKTAFLSSMSHEIRTPLNAILGFSQLMQHDTSLTEQNLDWIKTILRSGEHLLNLINDILEISKIESGMMTDAVRLNQSTFS